MHAPTSFESDTRPSGVGGRGAAAGWGGTGDPLHPGVAPVTVSAKAAGQSSMRGGESDKGKSAHKHKAVDAESRQGPLAMPTTTGMHHVG